MTDADAVPDGFATADALWAELRWIYQANPKQSLQAFRVRFRVLPQVEQHKDAR